MQYSPQSFPHLSILKLLHFTEISKCSHFTSIFFSRGLSSQVAVGGRGTGEVGPAKEDLNLQELWGKTHGLQMQPTCLALHGCVCSLIAMWASELISLRPKSLSPADKGLDFWSLMGIWPFPGHRRMLSSWVDFSDPQICPLLPPAAKASQGISRGSSTTDYCCYF